MFAIVKISNKQYIVSPKDIISVMHYDGEVGSTVTFPQVLLLSDDKKVTIGKPYIKGKKVTATILSQGKGKKMTVRRYKSKVRYRKAKGVRAVITRLEIQDF